MAFKRLDNIVDRVTSIEVDFQLFFDHTMLATPDNQTDGEVDAISRLMQIPKVPPSQELDDRIASVKQGPEMWRNIRDTVTAPLQALNDGELIQRMKEMRLVSGFWRAFACRLLTRVVRLRTRSRSLRCSWNGSKRSSSP
jgi:hypothetical protein